MSAKKTVQDGSGSYSYAFAHASYTSWLPDPVFMFEDMRARLCKRLAHVEGSDNSVEIVCFSRA